MELADGVFNIEKHLGSRDAEDVVEVFQSGKIHYLGKPTWWFIPLSKWVITLVINGISGGQCPTRVKLTHKNDFVGSFTTKYREYPLAISHILLILLLKIAIESSLIYPFNMGDFPLVKVYQKVVPMDPCPVRRYGSIHRGCVCCCAELSHVFVRLWHEKWSVAQMDRPLHFVWVLGRWGWSHDLHMISGVAQMLIWIMKIRQHSLLTIMSLMLMVDTPCVYIPYYLFWIFECVSKWWNIMLPTAAHENDIE